MPRKRKEPVFLIQSRVVYDRHPVTKKRYPGGKVVWGKWRGWTEHLENALNFRDAVQLARRRLARDRNGTIVYIRRVSDKGFPTRQVVKLFQAKWGHDNKPFTEFEGIAGYWWARQAGLVRRSRSKV